MKFIDEADIVVSAGDGGPGCVSFRREKFAPKGGPNGGDGGRGGSIYAEADENVDTLLEFHFMRRFNAKNGAKGEGKDKYGKGADDVFLRMPVGTVIKDADTGETLADLTRHGQKILLAKGGKGGLGNLHFKSSTSRAPRQSTPGEQGEARALSLELKLMADVGLLGLPNAGKSTLISAVSNARPKIADYPFTTLEPSLGVVGTKDSGFVMADIPGIIEGAAEGAGLGLRFLRHLSRTGLLAHLVDLGSSALGSDPAQDYAAVVSEIKKYDPKLCAKPRWLVLNKIDLLAGEEDVAVKRFLADIGWIDPSLPGPNGELKVFAISAASKKGVAELIDSIGKEIAQAKARLRESREAATAAQSDERFSRAPCRDEQAATAWGGATALKPLALGERAPDVDRRENNETGDGAEAAEAAPKIRNGQENGGVEGERGG